MQTKKDKQKCCSLAKLLWLLYIPCLTYFHLTYSNAAFFTLLPLNQQFWWLIPFCCSDTFFFARYFKREEKTKYFSAHWNNQNPALPFSVMVFLSAFLFHTNLTWGSDHVFIPPGNLEEYLGVCRILNIFHSLK